MSMAAAAAFGRFASVASLALNLVAQAGRRGRPEPQILRQQAVAAHFAVIVHAVTRVLGGESGPVPALAEHLQPVVAKPVFLVGAGVLRQELLDFAGRRHVEAGAQFPVGGVGFERVAPGQRQQLGQALAVALLESLVHLQDDLVAGLGRCLAAQRHREQCQNRS
jgi:hypothetical protein